MSPCSYDRSATSPRSYDADAIAPRCVLDDDGVDADATTMSCNKVERRQAERTTMRDNAVLATKLDDADDGDDDDDADDEHANDAADDRDDERKV